MTESNSRGSTAMLLVRVSKIDAFYICVYCIYIYNESMDHSIQTIEEDEERIWDGTLRDV